MATELEAKMRVPDHEPVRRQLQAAGGTRLGACMELNTFFDTPDRTLVAQDKGLRVRRTCDFATGDEKYVVTYKGPQQAGALKSREEIEIRADDGDNAALMLQRLGYAPTLSFEKRRESWRVDDCLVELDELPQLGCFVEIEGPDEEAVLGVREALDLDRHPLVKQNYIAMVAEALQSTGGRTLEFPT